MPKTAKAEKSEAKVDNDQPQPKAIELSRKHQLDKKVGMPKSGRNWKAGSERAGKHKKFCPKTWAEQMDDKRRMQALRARIRET